MSYTKQRAGIILQGPFADRPAASVGEYWYLSDEGGLYHSDGSAWTTVVSPGGSGVPTSRTLTAGAALTGGGDLTTDRTFDVAVDGSTIEVSSDALRVKDGGITIAKLSFDPATQSELDAAAASILAATQPLDSDLTALAGLSIAADTLPYGNGTHTMALATLTSFIRTLLDDADATTARATLGIVDAWDSRTQVSGSAFTTSNTSLTDITGLTFAAATNSLYYIEIVLDISTSADTAGCRYGVGFSAAGATASLDYHGGAATLASSILNGVGVQSGNILTAASATGHFRIFGIVRTGANAGNITAQAMKVTSGTATVQIGSEMKVKKLA